MNHRPLQRAVAPPKIAAAALQRLQSRLQRLGRCVLGIEVDRGIDLQAATFDVFDTVVSSHLLQHAIDVERNGCQAAALSEWFPRQRRGHGLLVCGLIDLPVFQQQVQNGVAPLHGQVGADERRIVVRAADHPRQQRRLRHIDLRDRLAEVELRRLADANDGDRPVAAQVDVVEVGLQDLSLGVLRVENHGHERFDELPPQRSFRRQVVVLHQLLRQRRCPLGYSAGAQIPKSRAEHSDRIDTRVMPEANVFRDDDRVLQMLRHLIERHRAAILELIAEDRCQLLRLERGLVQRPRIAQRDHRIDRRPAIGNADRLRLILPAGMGELARVDVHVAVRGDVIAGLLKSLCLAISEAVELFEKIVARNDHAGMQRREVRVDASG